MRHLIIAATCGGVSTTAASEGRFLPDLIEPLYFWERIQAEAEQLQDAFVYEHIGPWHN